MPFPLFAPGEFPREPVVRAFGGVFGIPSFPLHLRVRLLRLCYPIGLSISGRLYSLRADMVLRAAFANLREPKQPC